MEFAALLDRGGRERLLCARCQRCAPGLPERIAKRRSIDERRRLRVIAHEFAGQLTIARLEAAGSRHLDAREALELGAFQ